MVGCTYILWDNLGSSSKAAFEQYVMKIIFIFQNILQLIKGNLHRNILALIFYSIFLNDFCNMDPMGFGFLQVMNAPNRKTNLGFFKKNVGIFCCLVKTVLSACGESLLHLTCLPVVVQYGKISGFYISYSAFIRYYK